MTAPRRSDNRPQRSLVVGDRVRLAPDARRWWAVQVSLQRFVQACGGTVTIQVTFPTGDAP